MKRPAFAPLQGLELAHAVNAIEQVALDPADFVLEERRTDQQFSGGQKVIHKLISVTRVATGTQRQYAGGRGGGWPYEFERDLRCGVYGGGRFPGAPGAMSGVTP